jgi:hypothetical protein
MVLVAGLSCVASAASAQTSWLGAAIGWDVQRCAADETPNRLDGGSVGWTVLGGVLIARHLALTAEWADAGEISDDRTTSVNFGGRDVAIRSSFRHRTRAMSVVGGYHHSIVGS